MLAAILVGLLAIESLVISSDNQVTKGVNTVWPPTELDNTEIPTILYNNSAKDLLNNNAFTGLLMSSTMAAFSDQDKRETTTFSLLQETSATQKLTSNSFNHNANNSTLKQLQFGLNETTVLDIHQQLKHNTSSELQTEKIFSTVPNVPNTQEIKDKIELITTRNEGSSSTNENPFHLQKSYTTSGTTLSNLQEIGEISTHITTLLNTSDQMMVTISQNIKQGIAYTTQTLLPSTVTIVSESVVPAVTYQPKHRQDTDSPTELKTEIVFQPLNVTDLHDNNQDTVYRDFNGNVNFQYNVTGHMDHQDGNNTVRSNNITMNVQQKNDSKEFCPSLEVLDFLGNISDLNRTEMEFEWPCEVRSYWLNIKGLVTVVRFLFHKVAIVIVITGVLLNIISFCVLNTSPMNTCSVSVYLRALAIADIGVLLYNFTAVIRAENNIFNDYYLNNSGLCIMDRFLFVGSLYCSAWFVVALTLERLIMVIFPFNVHNWGTIRTATWTVAIITVLGISLAVLRTQISGFEKENVYEYKSCGAKAKYWSGYMYAFLAVGSWIPTTLILISNIYLLVQVRRSAHRRTNLSAYKIEGDSNTVRMTKILLLVSASYLISVLPLAIVSSIEMYWKAALGKQPANGLEYIKQKQNLLLLKWVRFLFFFFYIMNFACNFFLYYISGDKFRCAVKASLRHWLSLICFKKKSKLKNTLTQNSNHKNLESRNSNMSEDSKRRISDSSTTSELVYYNSAYINTETDTGTP